MENSGFNGEVMFPLSRGQLLVNKAIEINKINVQKAQVSVYKQIITLETRYTWFFLLKC